MIFFSRITFLIHWPQPYSALNLLFACLSSVDFLLEIEPPQAKSSCSHRTLSTPHLILSIDAL